MSLSGRVDELETKVTILFQDMLQKISISALSDFSRSWNQQFDALEVRYNSVVDELNILQVLYANLALGISGSTTIITGGSTGLQETFETISKNLKEYDYKLYYDTGSYLTGVRYTITPSAYVSKTLSYSASGLLTQVTLTGSPVPSTSLSKLFFYSGSLLTGVSYN